MKRERESRPLKAKVSEFYYRPFPGEMKTEIKEETPSAQKSEDELLKEDFTLQLKQIQGMLSSQQQLATADTPVRQAT